MRYTFFLNGERGLYVLKKLLKKKHLSLVKVVFCRKSIKKQLQKIINLKKTKYLENINQKKSLIELKSIFLLENFKASILPSMSLFVTATSVTWSSLSFILDKKYS